MIMTYIYKPKCRNCGKVGSKYCESVYTDEPYNGNQIIVKRHKQKVFSKFHTDVWDGETYKLNAGKFCTNRCAIEWANENAIQPKEADQ